MAKILVIDDEPEILRAVRMVLEMDGHQVELQTDAQRAVPQILSGAYDLVVLDLLMPLVTGEEMLRQLKGSGTTPVVILSGTGDLFDIGALIELGAYTYMEKPFEPAKLLEVVRDAINSRRGQ
jgi:DNA-binding response OmpR family regulator